MGRTGVPVMRGEAPRGVCPRLAALTTTTATLDRCLEFKKKAYLMHSTHAPAAVLLVIM